MVRIALFLGVLLYPAGLLAQSNMSSACLHLAAGPGPLTQYLAKPFIQAMKERGICLTIRHFPPKRASYELAQKTIDGELLRVALYARAMKEHADMVPEALIKGQGVLLSRQPDIQDYKSYRDKRVIYPRGIKWAAKVSKDFTNIFQVDEKKNGFEMVHVGRADAMFIDDVAWQPFAKQYPDLHTSFVMDLTAYMILAKRHADRIPEIAAAIRDHREKEGGIPGILKQFRRQN